jgi:DNA-binding SARP family transcriptional activator
MDPLIDHTHAAADGRERRRTSGRVSGQPIRVHTLGRFGIQIHGAALPIRQIRQQKPIELLQCAIAMGGRRVNRDALSAALWPESDGDAAANSYDVTLHRLRKLLKHEHALIASGNGLTINNAVIWVDVWTLEKLLHQIDDATSLVACDDEAYAIQLLNQAVTLYQGGFLAHDAHKPWGLSMHERLRSKLIRCIGQTGRQAEKRDRWGVAARCYQAGIEMDPLYELFYQRLMICYRQADRKAEALAAYRRCRSNLASGLCIAPSLETESIFRTL